MSRHQNTSRRGFLKLAAWVGIVPYLTTTVVACAVNTPKWRRAPDGPFRHGVASGDPLTDRVILWTRVTDEVESPVQLRWEVAEDEAFRVVVAEGIGTTSGGQDYTFKVDAMGLNAGSSYFYRFNYKGLLSPVGRTKTLPDTDVKSVKLAIASCSNFPAGFFHVYEELAKEELDAVLHLGDYMYEYSSRGYATAGSKKRDRVPVPKHETVTLSDYRTRHAQYRSDLALQECHQAHAFIVVWDDHEVANNSFSWGAKNHDADEGLFSDRKSAALQAWFEWMPIRTPANQTGDIFREFHFGNLVNLLMLDTRLKGRDKQLELTEFQVAGRTNARETRGAAGEPSRALLGDQQKAWLLERLKESSAKWQMLGQQVLMSRYTLPAKMVETVDRDSTSSFEEGLLAGQKVLDAMKKHPRNHTQEEEELLDSFIPYNLDAWDGYAAERDEVLEAAHKMGKRLISVGGDTHNAWASRLTTRTGDVVGAEFGTASVSSPGFERELGRPGAQLFGEMMEQLVPDLEWTQLTDRGFARLEFTPDEVRAEFEFVDTVKKLSYTRLPSHTLRVSRNLELKRI